MVFRYRPILKYQVFRAYFHRQYEQVKIHTSDNQPLACKCQSYTKKINDGLSEEFKIDADSPLPNKVPDYKKHVLVLSPQNKNADDLEWMTHWQSKMELNPVWPYSIIADLKTHLQHTKFGSDILVNAISMHSGSLAVPSRDPKEKAHVFVIPDMKLYKISPQDIPSFAHFLGGGQTRKAANHKLSFTDFLKGADNIVNQVEMVPEPGNANYKFPYEVCTRDWILICGHNQRDRRCGILGKKLIEEVSAKRLHHDKNVALISHIGGHKFAGNLILYKYEGINPKTNGGKLDALWFARVSPPNLTVLLEHVNVEKIPQEYYRGGLSIN